MKKNKGFTLVEVIVAITILGIVTIMAIPIINYLSYTFKDRKLEVYRESILSAAKLEIDNNSVDYFGFQNKGCVDIPYNDLLKTKLLSDVDFSDYKNVEQEKIIVRVHKSSDKYEYEAFITKEELEGAKSLSCIETINTDGPAISVKVMDTSGITKTNKIKIDIVANAEEGLTANQTVKYELVDYNTNNVVETLPEFSLMNKEGLGSATGEIDIKDKNGKYFVRISAVRVRNLHGISSDDVINTEPFIIDNEPPKIKITVKKDSSTGTNLGTINTGESYVVAEWRNHGFFFDVSESDDNSVSLSGSSKDILKQTVKKNGTKNVILDKTLTSTDKSNGLKNFNIAGHGARYATYELCDKAGNCSGVTININISTVYTVVYRGNGNNGGNTNPTTCYYGIDCKLANNGFTKKGYSFDKWTINGNDYDAGSNVNSLVSTDGGSIDALVKWKINYYTVNYKVNGNIWQRRSVKYGDNIDYDLNPSSIIEEIKIFKKWKSEYSIMPDYDITVEAVIDYVNCLIISGNETYNRVERFQKIWEGIEVYSDIQYLSDVNTYRAVTKKSYPYPDALKYRDYLYDNTTKCYSDNYMVFSALTCDNGKTYSHMRGFIINDPDC